MTLDIPPGAEVVDVQTTAGTYQPIASGEGSKPLAWEISRLAGHARRHDAQVDSASEHADRPGSPLGLHARKRAGIGRGARA